MMELNKIIKEEIETFIISEGHKELVDYFSNTWSVDKNTIDTINSSNYLKSKYGSYLNYGPEEWNMMSYEDLKQIWDAWDVDYLTVGRTRNVNEMSSRASAPIESDGYWIDMVNSAKENFGIDNVEVVGFNTKSPKVRITKSGFKPITMWNVKSEHLPYLTVGANYEYITNWLLNDVIPKFVDKFEEKERNIRKLPDTASVGDKIKMLRLVGEKAYTEYSKRPHSELWIQTIYEKYGDYWTKLYDQIENTPEWEEYRKKHGIARSINFGDVLA